MRRRHFVQYLGTIGLFACGPGSSTRSLDLGPSEAGSRSEPLDLTCLDAELSPDTVQLPFEEQDGASFGTARGQGLNGRLYTDLSRLTSETLLTPTEQFYIRTRYPGTLNAQTTGSLSQWTVAVEGAVATPARLSMATLLEWTEDQGVHLMECSGNFRAGGFGLMSAATFRGVPLSRVLQSVTPLAEAALLEIEGYDEHTDDGGGRSTPGASWILTPKQFEQTGAFLATHMNDEPLPLDHGFPVRLLNPGWYGCSCVKWVRALRWLKEDAPASSQMREFAARTHQVGTPELARDYAPPNIEVAAQPVRVEQWRDEQGLFYRVVGIVWGGERPVTALELSFDGGESFVSVECGDSGSERSWRLWSVQWQPTKVGLHDLVCRLPDSSIPARRLDSQYYRRRVDVLEI